MKAFSALLAGIIFGLGLILSGMTNPAKVIGFLDIFGAWDPSLALVMGGAILVGLFAFSYARTRSRSILGASMKIPANQQLDRRLILGATTFGIGWGLAGYCPGPAVASLLTGGIKPVVFTLGMLAGMAIFTLLERYTASAKSDKTSS